MCGWDRVFLEQTGHEGTQPHPEDLRPRAVAVPKDGAQDVQGLCDPRGGCGAQGLFDVAHNPLGARGPVMSLQAGQSPGWASPTQVQVVCQELPSRRGHEQAGVSLQGEDGVQGAWGGGRGEKTVGSAGTGHAGGRRGHSTGQRPSAEPKTSGEAQAPPTAGGAVRGPAVLCLDTEEPELGPGWCGSVQ